MYERGQGFLFEWDGSPVVILKIKILPHLDVPPRAALNCMRPPFCKNSSAIASVLLVHLLPATSLPFDPPSPSPSSPSAAFVPTRSVRSSSSSSTTSTMSTDEQSEQPPQGLNGMDLVIDGWFHERGVLWPGQAMSLEVRPSPLAPRARSAPRPARHVAHVERCGRCLLISCAPAADRGDAAG